MKYSQRGKYPIYKTQTLQADRTPVTTSERWNNMPKVQQPAREGQARPWTLPVRLPHLLQSQATLMTPSTTPPAGAGWTGIQHCDVDDPLHSSVPSRKKTTKARKGWARWAGSAANSWLNRDPILGILQLWRWAMKWKCCHGSWDHLLWK